MSFRRASLAVIPYILNRRPGSIPKAVLQIRINRKPAREPEHEFALLSMPVRPRPSAIVIPILLRKGDLPVDPEADEVKKLPCAVDADNRR